MLVRYFFIKCITSLQIVEGKLFQESFLSIFICFISYSVKHDTIYPPSTDLCVKCYIVWCTLSSQRFRKSTPSDLTYIKWWSSHSPQKHIWLFSKYAVTRWHKSLHALCSSMCGVWITTITFKTLTVLLLEMMGQTFFFSFFIQFKDWIFFFVCFVCYKFPLLAMCLISPLFNKKLKLRSLQRWKWSAVLLLT